MEPEAVGALVSAREHVIAMEKLFQVRIVAEGVEEREQYITLRKLGCDEIQGYMFGRPLPRNEFEVRMRRALS